MPNDRWLYKQLEEAKEEVKKWPQWKADALRLTNENPSESREAVLEKKK